MKFHDDGQIRRIDLDNTEETAFAKMVFSIILLPGVIEEHSIYLINQIYKERANGFCGPLDKFVRSLEIATFYESRGAVLPIPKIPQSTGGIRFSVSREEFNYDRDYWSTETRHLRILAWKTAYEKFPQLQQWGEFRTLIGQIFINEYILPQREKRRAGEEEHYDGKLQMDIEKVFFEEVARVQKEYECTFHEAEILVSDYMKRGVDGDGVIIADYRKQQTTGITLAEQLDSLFDESTDH